MTSDERQALLEELRHEIVAEHEETRRYFTRAIEPLSQDIRRLIAATDALGEKVDKRLAETESRYMRVVADLEARIEALEGSTH